MAMRNLWFGKISRVALLDIILIPFLLLSVLQVPMSHKTADEVFVDKVFGYQNNYKKPYGVSSQSCQSRPNSSHTGIKEKDFSNDTFRNDKGIKASDTSNNRRDSFYRQDYSGNK